MSDIRETQPLNLPHEESLALIEKNLSEALQTLKLISEDRELLERIYQVSNLIFQVLSSGNKVLIAGNGGSAADSQHLAAEIVGAFESRDVKGFPAIALTTDTSVLTALSNDYGYENLFARQLEALGSPGDLLIAISTSGNSPNILKALERARSLGIKTISLLGKGGGKAKGLADIELIVPSYRTARVQEAHTLIIHLICDLIERYLKNKYPTYRER